MQQLLVAVTPLLDKPLTREGFRDQLTVMTENDPSLLRLTVEYREAEVAATIANRWADLFVHQTNQIIGDQSQEQMQFYTTQRDNALRALNQAEQILVTFQAANRVRIVKAELSAQETALQQALSRQRDSSPCNKISLPAYPPFYPHRPLTPRRRGGPDAHFCPRFW